MKLSRRLFIMTLMFCVVLFVLVATLPSSVADLEPQLEWENTFGGIGDYVGWSLQVTGDGGYIITGYTVSSGAGGRDLYLVKTDSGGNLEWEKTFGGTGEDYGRSVQVTGDGGYIITGNTYSSGAGGRDLYLVKADSRGNLVREKTFGGTGDDYGRSVQVTGDGGYIITGYTESSGAGGADVYLVKTGFSGNLVWEKTFGGLGEDYGMSVQVTGDGGYIITGNTYSSGAGGRDLYLVKADSGGNLVWEKTFGGTGEDNGMSVQVTGDGGYITTGYTESSGAGGADVYLVKTDYRGNLVWEKTFGGLGEDYGMSVQVTGDGGYIITGYTASSGAGGRDVYLVKVDSGGNLLWEKTFGGTGEDYGRSVQVTGDGGYIIAGTTGSSGAGGMDVYLVKTYASEQASVANVNGPYIGLVGEAIIFNSSGSDDVDGNIVEYRWDFGDESGYYYGENPVHTYSETGTFLITLRVTDNEGLEDTAITLCSVSPQLNIEPVVNMNGPYEGNVEIPVRFNSSGTRDPDGTIIGYRWDFDDGSEPNYGENPSHTYSRIGNYYVTLQVTDTDGAIATATSLCTIFDPSNRAPTADANGPYTGFAGSPVSFRSTGSDDPDGKIIKHEWIFGDGSISEGTNPRHTYQETGNYTVTLRVTDNKGAEGSTTTWCDVDPWNLGGIIFSILGSVADPSKWSLELLAFVFAVTGTAIGGTIGIARWVRNSRIRNTVRKRTFQEYMERMDDVYTQYKMNSRQCEAELIKLRTKVMDDFKFSIIDERNFNILDKRIDEYILEIRAEFVHTRLREVRERLEEDFQRMKDEGDAEDIDFDALVQMIESTPGLSEEDRKELGELVAGWREKHQSRA